jgi:mannitol-1-phosphate 5-dehydrogenase
MDTKPLERSIAIFGAGKIGRSFIGQLFSKAGYKIIFIDIDPRIIDELNRLGKYEVIIKSDVDKIIEVTNVCGVSALNKNEVINTIANCSLMATCVGKNAFTKILPVLAKGIEKRYALQPDYPLDIILAENIREACQLVKNGLSSILRTNFPIDFYIGLIETSIGKMVPIMPKEIESKDPLLVYAELYNSLILDKNGFKNPVPEVDGLSPKENIKAWVDRKAFIHNLGHVAAAYFGYYKYPNQKYLYEVLEDEEVENFTRKTMQQAAKALLLEYPNDFTPLGLNDHIDDLICRFKNKSLGDTIFRVGSDLKRKLGEEDRVVGAIRLAQKVKSDYDKIVQVLYYGLRFRAADEFNRLLLEDKEFTCQIMEDLGKVLSITCGFDPLRDKGIIQIITR